MVMMQHSPAGSKSGKYYSQGVCTSATTV